jgi:hypothetical protein
MKVFSVRMSYFLALIAFLIFSNPSISQIRYASGQNVVPVFEGWDRNADGTFTMVFGYMNRNYEEEVEIPIGPNNKLEPGEADQNQPTHFYPRRQEFVFKVKVPAGWGDKDLVWTLVSHGKTEKAYGSLMPVWELGNLVYQENRRGAASLTYPEEPNKAPTIEMLGSSQRTVASGEPLTLSVEVADDGYPKPVARPQRTGSRDGRRGTMARPQSPVTQAVVKLDPGVRLGVTWVVYRGGLGNVTFNPMRIPVVMTASGDSPVAAGPITGKATTNVVFSQPGTYVLRAYADDGVLTAPLDVTVTVQDVARQ